MLLQDLLGIGIGRQIGALAFRGQVSLPRHSGRPTAVASGVGPEFLLGHLIEIRQLGVASFTIWPFEARAIERSHHVIAETYPALFPFNECAESAHHGDARRVAGAASKALKGGTLSGWFEIPEIPFGRYTGVSLRDQISFEGWILGVH